MLHLDLDINRLLKGSMFTQFQHFIDINNTNSSVKQISLKFFHFMEPTGLNLWVFNLKFLQIVVHIFVYKL